MWVVVLQVCSSELREPVWDDCDILFETSLIPICIRRTSCGFGCECPIVKYDIRNMGAPDI